jgi:hypothetical protein
MPRRDSISRPVTPQAETSPLHRYLHTYVDHATTANDLKIIRPGGVVYIVASPQHANVWVVRLNPGANPTIVSYNPSAV